ncbi:MAG: hypothetical protein V1750_05840 [Acidobacteriota bacterium]
MMRRLVAVIWLLVPPLLLSALIHAADRDVGGLRGLTSLAVVASVAIWSLPVVACASLCLASLLRGSTVWFAVTLGLLAAALGGVITAMGSTAATAAGRTGSFLGASAIALLTLAVSAVGTAAILRSGRTRDFTPMLREAIAEMRLAGAFAPALELEEVLGAAYTTSSELLGELGLAILKAMRGKHSRLPGPTRRKLRQCLREIRKTWSDIRLP